MSVRSLRREYVKRFIYYFLFICSIHSVTAQNAVATTIIAHPSVVIDNLSRAQLRSIFLCDRPCGRMAQRSKSS